MSERKNMPDLMGEVLGGKRQPEQSSSAAGIPVEDSGMVLMSLRLPGSWRERLRAHFRAKGVDLSNGLRLALSEYMEREGLK